MEWVCSVKCQTKQLVYLETEIITFVIIVYVCDKIINMQLLSLFICINLNHVDKS